MKSPWPPGAPRRRRYSRAVWLQVLIALVAITAGAYFVYREFSEAGVEFNTSEQAMPGADRRGAGPGSDASGRSDRILRCTSDDGSVFYTNAASCGDADLDKRVNVVPSREPDKRIGRNCLSDDPDFEERHQFLAACREDFFQALRVEKYLSRARDPAASRRAREYCDLIAQGVSKGCLATSTIFCYLPVCQELAARSPDP